MNDEPLVSYWRSIALPIAVVLVSVEVQRHWGSHGGWIYLLAGLLLDITWVGTLLGYRRFIEASGIAIDVALFFLLLYGVWSTSFGGYAGGEEILQSLFFWAPAICGWWALSYQEQFNRVLIYAALFYGGLSFGAYPDTGRHYYEHVMVGVLIVGLIRLVAGGMRAKHAQEMAALRSQALDSSMRDPVTGVASKLYFEAELAHISAVANRYHFPFSLIICCVEEFEHYVAVRGEVAANELLKTVSWKIAERIRTPDTICRLQGGEFAILLPSTVEQDAIKVAENIRSSVSEIPSVGDHSLGLRVAVNQHKFGEDPMATFDTVYRHLEQSSPRVDAGQMPSPEHRH
jgi:diguanylate cyclase (GGDEF)-like protein